MASITSDPNGRKRILFVGPDGFRRPIRLGKASMKQAEAFKVKVEQLVSAKITGATDDETARWVAGLDDVAHEKLAAVGLIPKRQSHAAEMLGQFVADYLATRTDIKPSTRRHLQQASDNLIAFFTATKPLRDVTAGDADEFRRHLLQRLGDNTTRRMCGRAKQLFRAALRKRLIAENPFGDMKGCTVQPNRARDYFVTRQKADEIVDACPDAQWRLLFALSRFGGLRCPSEHLGLKWGNVDWERNRILVHSPKTEHHPGGESRLVPLFPELRPYLEEVFDAAEPGTEYVITRYRPGNGSHINLGPQLKRIIRRAGLKPWPKVWHNLRATRETELAERWPKHVVCAWIGNSRLVARKHYLQVTDEHFERAATAGEQAAQNPAQQPAESRGTDSQGDSAGTADAQELQHVAGRCDFVPEFQMPRVGLEPTTT